MKGLGNLQQHFAYNSAYLAYAALFSIFACICGWFFLAPFIRYGLAFLLVFPLMALGLWIRPEKMGPVRSAAGCGEMTFRTDSCRNERKRSENASKRRGRSENDHRANVRRAGQSDV